MNLVDCPVKRTPMEGTMRKIMPGILQNKEDRDLVCHSPERREGDRGGETEILCHRVKKPGQWSVTWYDIDLVNRIPYQIWGNSTVKWLSRTSLAQFHCSCTEGILFYSIGQPSAIVWLRVGLLTLWILYFLNNPKLSMMTQGSDRPK